MNVVARFRLPLALALVSGLAAASSAQVTRTWMSAFGGDWNDPSFWSANNVPDSINENAYINSTSFLPISVATSVGCRNLQLANNDAQIRVESAADLTIGDLGTPGAIINMGAIAIDAQGIVYPASLVFGQAVTISGTGAIEMFDNAQIRSLHQAGWLTQESGHRIVGQGLINASMTNRGLIRATSNVLPLTLTGAFMVCQNGGVMEAENATLDLNIEMIIVGASSTIRARNVGGPGLVRFSASDQTVSGGSLVTEGIDSYFNLAGAHLTLENVSNQADFMLDTGTAITLSGDITNTGTFYLNPNGHAFACTVDFADSSTHIHGLGAIDMVAPSILGSGAGDYFRNGLAHRIRGSGTLAATTFVNEGNISTSTGQTLALTGTSFSNSGVMLAVDATCDLGTQTFTQSESGLVELLGSSVNITTPASISGGQFNSDGTSMVFVTSPGTQLGSILMNCPVTVHTGADIRCHEGIIFGRDVFLNPAGHAFASSLIAVPSIPGGEVHLNGSATIHMVSPAILDDENGVFVLNSGLSVVGSGAIPARFVNHGVVHAQGGDMILNNGQKDNFNLITVDSAASLTIDNCSLVQQGAGQIFLANAPLEFAPTSPTRISGGVINGNGNARIITHTSLATFGDLEVRVPTEVETGIVLNVDGALKSHSLINLSTPYAFASTLQFAATGSLHATSTGSVTIGDIGHIGCDSGSFIDPATHTVRGLGQFDCSYRGAGKLEVRRSNSESTSRSMAITGDYMPTSNHELLMTAQVDADHLDVVGQARLRGTLRLSIAPNFTPVDGETVTLITSQGPMTGSFSPIHLGTLPPNTNVSVQIQGNTLVAVFAVGICASDFNDDGVTDFFDYLDFVDAFASNQPIADFNQDSVIDFFDYLDFVDVFSTGC